MREVWEGNDGWGRIVKEEEEMKRRV